MVQSSVTISLVPEAAGGPFVFWEDLEQSASKAAEIGFDAVEVFPPSGEDLRRYPVNQVLRHSNLNLAAIGSGGGWLLNRWHLCHPEEEVRTNAIGFVEVLIEAAGELGAPVIIGSMQGKVRPNDSREQALDWLKSGLNRLAGRAKTFGLPLFFEPLNRYETNLVNRLDEGVTLLQSLETDNVRLLADLFHMNIEEASIPEALRQAGDAVGHIHFVDSNRRPAGNGHIDFGGVATALSEMDYRGYCSAEALPYPDSESAARQTLKMFRCYWQDQAR